MNVPAAAHASDSIPLPPPRPAEAAPAPTPSLPTPQQPQDSGPRSEPPKVTAEEPQACPERLRKAGFVLEEAQTPRTENELCRIEVPVRLLSVPVALRPERSVTLKEKPILACDFAESFGHWLSDLAAPAVTGSLSSDLVAVHTGPGFECRNRNRAASGKLSAHATGLAIDIASFELADGTRLGIKPGDDARRNSIVSALRKAACGWFTTILGPGSDPSHADHLHVDIQKHGSSDRYRICD